MTMSSSHVEQKKKFPEKRHIVTLAFDDGFRQSFTKVAAVYEEFGLSACLNVIAAPDGEGAAVNDEYINSVGDFTLWNELQDRGHEIMPHSLRHSNLTELPLAEATDLMQRCFNVFQKELKGFDTRKCIFNFPYNASSPELEQWLSSRVLAFRTGGSAINPWPDTGVKRLTCDASGPENCEKHLDATIAQLLASDRGWLIYNTHGLDTEGWGPIRETYLKRLLGRLTAIDSVDILPTAKAIEKYSGAKIRSPQS
jgi:peptidoglycan/xylan/chitin deacetylase (PgdA/CDA1 family)